MKAQINIRIESCKVTGLVKVKYGTNDWSMSEKLVNYKGLEKEIARICMSVIENENKLERQAVRENERLDDIFQASLVKQRNIQYV